MDNNTSGSVGGLTEWKKEEEEAEENSSRGLVSDEGLSGGLIAGISLVGLLVVIVLGIVVLRVSRRRKRRRKAKQLRARRLKLEEEEQMPEHSLESAIEDEVLSQRLHPHSHNTE